MIGPATIELCPLLVSQLQLRFAFSVGEAVPQRHRKLGTVARRKLDHRRADIGTPQSIPHGPDNSARFQQAFAIA